MKDLDSDGTLEIVTSAQTPVSADDSMSFLYVVGTTSEGACGMVWSSDEHSTYVTRIRSADVDGDGFSEIYAGFPDGEVDVYDGRTHAKSTFDSGGARAFEIVDLDGDGSFEYVGTNGIGLVVRAARAPYTLKWTTTTFGGDDLAVGNTDGDSALEIVTSREAGHGQVVDGVTHALEWDNVTGFGSRIRVGDIDGDNMDEIVGIFTPNGPVQCFDADVHAFKWEIPFYSITRGLNVVDTDGDGVSEVLLWSEQLYGIACYEGPSGARRWLLPLNSYDVFSVASGDTDSDGSTEVVFTQMNGGGDSQIYIANPLSEVVEWKCEDMAAGSSEFEVADVDDDGTDEIVSVSVASHEAQDAGVISVFDTVSHVRDTAVIHAWDWVEARHLAVGDLDGDGRTEIAVTTAHHYTPVIQVFDGRSLNFLRESGPETAQAITVLAIGDVDGDGSAEIVEGLFPKELVIRDGKTLQEEWRSGDLPGFYGSVHDIILADLDADGTMEILTYTYGDPRVLVFNGVTHALEWAIEVPVSAIEVADLDQDGALDVLVGEEGGVVQVYEGSGFALKATYHFGTAPIIGLHVADLEGNGRLRMIVSEGHWLSVYDAEDRSIIAMTQTFALGVGIGNNIRTIHPQDGGPGHILYLTSTALREVVVEPHDEPPRAVAGADMQVQINTLVTLDGSGSCKPGGRLVLYEWDFDGDGSYDSSGSVASVTHVYATPGLYRASLRVTDDDGETATDSLEIVVMMEKVVLLITPNGGEVLRSGEVVQIRWAAYPNIAYVSLLYRQGPGRPWKIVQEGLSASLGHFAFTLPRISKAHPKSQFKVVALDAAKVRIKRAFDLSDGFLTLSP